jgi:acyl-CoA reductase-like NAD-dependent aldehyde dehydrogenase
VGNSVILKPAPQTPLTGKLLGEVLAEAGLPDGALSVVHCAVPQAEALVKDERIAMVTFTGSAKVGWHVKDIAGKKKVALELGGNGAVVVAEDADVGLRRRVACAVAWCTAGSTASVCSASSSIRTSTTASKPNSWRGWARARSAIRSKRAPTSAR